MPAVTKFIKALLLELPAILEIVLPTLIDIATTIIDSVLLDPEFIDAFAKALFESIVKVKDIIEEKLGTSVLGWIIAPGNAISIEMRKWLDAGRPKPWDYNPADTTTEEGAASNNRSFSSGGAGYESNNGGTKLTV